MRVAIDISNTYHKSYAIVSNYPDFDITQEKWQLTLGRKFVTDLLSIVKKFPSAKQVILAFDAKDNFRKSLSVEYKAHRSRKQQEFYDVLQEIHDILAEKGLNCAKIDGLEADDIMALCNESAGDMFSVLVSNDEDLRQLVSENTVVFTANTNNFKLFCDKVHTVAKHFPDFIQAAQSIDPDLIFFEKLFLGCDGDNVKRLLPKGHGPKKVQAIYEKLNYTDLSIEQVLKDFGYDITEEQINAQTKMVCLGSQYMPKHLSDIYFKKSFNFVPVETDMKKLLQGTRYIQ